MAKRKKTIRAGSIVKTILYTAPEPRDGDRARAEKSRMTTAAQKAMNDKTARGRLEMLLAVNFFHRDSSFVTLTYRDGALPAKRAGALKLVRKFLATLRTARRARGKQLRYIYTTEEKHGEARLHHHLVMNITERSLEEIRSLWLHGDVIGIRRIDEREYAALAAYITKASVEGRPVGAQMWTGSRNLAKPVVTVEYVSDDTTLAIPPEGEYLEGESRGGQYGSYCYIKYRLPGKSKSRR